MSDKIVEKTEDEVTDKVEAPALKAGRPWPPPKPPEEVVYDDFPTVGDDVIYCPSMGEICDVSWSGHRNLPPSSVMASIASDVAHLAAYKNRLTDIPPVRFHAKVVHAFSDGQIVNLVVYDSVGSPHVRLGVRFLPVETEHDRGHGFCIAKELPPLTRNEMRVIAMNEAAAAAVFKDDEDAG